MEPVLGSFTPRRLLLAQTISHAPLVELTSVPGPHVNIGGGGEGSGGEGGGGKGGGGENGGDEGGGDGGSRGGGWDGGGGGGAGGGDGGGGGACGGLGGGGEEGGENITHELSTATLASGAKFLADGMVPPSTRATHPALTVATES